MEVDEVPGTLSWDALLNPGSPPQRVPGPALGGPHWAKLMARMVTEAEREVNELARMPPEGGVVVCSVRGKYCTSQAGFFKEWARALRFPDYFGYNWDAFDECISDLLALDDGGIGAEYGDRESVTAMVVLVLVTHSENLLTDEPERVFQIMVSSLEQAALGSRFSEQVPPSDLAALRILFQCEPEEADAVRERFYRAVP